MAGDVRVSDQESAAAKALWVAVMHQRRPLLLLDDPGGEPP
jgi:hypothetical protein